MSKTKKGAAKQQAAAPTNQTQLMNVNQPLKGMNTDVDSLLLDKSHYTFALNAKTETNKGDLGSISNYHGNAQFATIPTGYSIIGSILLSDDSTVLFLTNNTTSVIATVDQAGTYTEIVSNTCLGFSTKYPMDEQVHYYKTCERTIYFTDNFNKPRYINLDDLDAFKDDAGDWDCDKFSIFRDYIKPNIDLSVVNSGGNLKVGTYQFSIRYTDDRSNYTNWNYITDPIPIVYESLGTTYDNITGAYDTTNTLSRHGVGATNKYIQVDVSNLDTRFQYYQLAVIQNISGVGVTTNTYVLKPSTIDGTTATYIYDDVGTANIAATTTVTDLITDDITFDTAKSIEIINNRMIYANTTEKEYDYGKFQVLANDITTQYVTKQVIAESITSGENYSTKNAKHYTDNRSLMRGEVYAVGIVFHLINGKDTPSFHIPGRAKDSISVVVGNNNSGASNRPNAVTAWDSETILSTNLDNYSTTDLERWQVYNTATRLDNTATDFGNGDCAYYECTNTYPNVVDTTGAIIYPNTGGVMHNVRHHKMPDTNLVEHAQNIADIQYIYPLGMTFSNISYPAEYAADIVGYSITIANKVDTDQAVIDKGIMGTAIINTIKTKVIFNALKKSEPLGYYLSPSIPFNSARTIENGFQSIINIADSAARVATNMVTIDSPQVKFNGSALLGDYVKIEGLINTDGQGLAFKFADSNVFKGAAILRKFERLPAAYTGSLNYTRLASVLGSYNTIDTTAGSILGTYTGSIGTLPLRVYNSGYCQSTAYVKIDRDAETTLFAFEDYGHVGDENYAQANYNIYGYYVTMMSNLINIHGDLESLTYRRMSKDIELAATTSTTVFGGDSFITKFDFRQSIQNTTTDDEQWDFRKPDTPGSTFAAGKNSYIHSNQTFYVESRINTEYRNVGEFDYETFYTKNANILDLTNHVDGNLDIVDAADYALQEDYFSYNVDYSIINDKYPYIPLQNNYKVSLCNTFLYRIWYSEQNLNESTLDNHKVILANSYKSLDTHYGEINDLFVYQDNLFAHTNKSLYALPTRPQQLQTNENTVYVGQGDFLSVPAKNMSSLAYGYAGSYSKYSTIVTEAGVLFVDVNRRKVFLFREGKGLMEIHANGKRKWFEENLTMNLLDEWDKVMTMSYPFATTHDANGVGFLSYYDKDYKMLFVTKRDYSFNVTFLGEYDDVADANKVEGGLYYSTTSDRFVVYTSALVSLVDMSNQTYFINKCYTISYDIMTEMWKSYHSFIPHAVYEDNKNFYTFINDDNVWNHNHVNPYCTYYGTKYDHVIDFVINERSIQDKVLSSMAYVSQCLRDEYVIQDITYNQMYIYTTTQHTGLQTMTVKSTPYQSIGFQSTVLVKNINNTWKFNKFRDNVETHFSDVINTSSWTDTNYKSYFNGTQGYIDTVPNTLVINSSKNIYTKSRFKSKYMNVRLFFNPIDNIKIKTNIVFTRMMMEPYNV